MPVTPAPKTVALAYFKPLAGPTRTSARQVHFNPASLQYTVTNTLAPTDSKRRTPYSSSAGARKLTMIWYSIPRYRRVRETTQNAKLLRPYETAGQGAAQRRIGWGHTSLRASSSSTRKRWSFSPQRRSAALLHQPHAVAQRRRFDSARIQVPRSTVRCPRARRGARQLISARRSKPLALAISIGDPRAARSIAYLSGSENLRFGGGQPARGLRQRQLVASCRFFGGRRTRHNRDGGEAFAGLRVAQALAPAVVPPIHKRC